jgi:predicted DNA-binding protein (UPF0251 family)
MPRPPCCRKVQEGLRSGAFAPVGKANCAPEEVLLTLDELEALRLADLEGFYQEQAAESLGVSRATFGRIILAAHRKVADALVNGKRLTVGGGAVRIMERQPCGCGADHDAGVCHSGRCCEVTQQGDCRRRRQRNPPP